MSRITTTAPTLISEPTTNILRPAQTAQASLRLRRLRGGKLGGFLAGLGFMLPGFVLMLALSILYVEANLAGHLDELFYGLTAAVGAVVARAVVRLSRTFITDVPLALIAVAGFALTLFVEASFVLVLLGAGLAYELWTNASRWTRRAHSFSLGPAILVVLAGTVTVSLTAQIFWEGLKAGLLTFGGAFTVIPFLQQSSVDVHPWLTDSQFVDGLAMSGVLPAPLIIFSTFVGYVAGGLTGALVMTLGIFLPAFVFPIFFHHQLVAVAHNVRLHPVPTGVAAGVIGLIASVTVQIVDTSVVDLPTALLAIGAFLALNRWHSKLTVVYVVLGRGLIGSSTAQRHGLNGATAAFHAMHKLFRCPGRHRWARCVAWMRRRSGRCSNSTSSTPAPIPITLMRCTPRTPCSSFRNPASASSGSRTCGNGEAGTRRKPRSRSGRCRGRDDLWITELSVRYDNGPEAFGLAIHELRGDKIARETIYYAEGFEPPEWRAQWTAAP